MNRRLTFRQVFSVTTLTVMLLATFALIPMAAAQSPCGERYTVRAGDSLSEIAERCNTTLLAVIRANPQIDNPSLIFPGMQINIPSEMIPDTGAQAQVTVSPRSGVPGTTVTVRGSGFPDNGRVRVGPGVRNAEPVYIETVSTNEDGRFSIQITIPSNADPDTTWVILAATQGGGESITTEFNVVPRLEARTYTVESGDTLFEIASRFDTSVNALVRANPEIEDPTLIFPGQELVLPGSLAVVPDTGRRVYVVEAGDTLGEIALRFGTTVESVLDANPDIEDASRIFPGERFTIPAPVNVIPDTGRVVYTVQQGDTLSEIAARFGTTVQALLNLNSEISDADLIFPGQRITIPRRDL